MKFSAARLMTAFLLAFAAGIAPASSDGLVGVVVSSPIFANGTVQDMRSGINIYLQRDDARGLDFMDPKVVGYGIPPGGRLEVEMVSGFQRDPGIALAQPSILLVAGTPQQALPGRTVGYSVSEGHNRNTFVITPSAPNGLDAAAMTAAAPGAKTDPIPQRGIKIVHVGMKMAFVSRGSVGTVEVRIIDGNGKVVDRGRGELKFLPEPRPQIFPTNIPHAKRNHNWQRLAPGQILGQAEGTLPIAFLLFERNQGFGNRGILGAGVLSRRELEVMNYSVPPALKRYTGGLIVKDANGDGLLEPGQDQIIGGFAVRAPRGASGQEVRTPLLKGALQLSRPTGAYNQRAAAQLGGAIMLLEFVAGDKKGIYRASFALLSDPADMTGPDGSTYTYSIAVE